MEHAAPVQSQSRHTNNNFIMHYSILFVFLLLGWQTIYAKGWFLFGLNVRLSKIARSRSSRLGTLICAPMMSYDQQESSQIQPSTAMWDVHNQQSQISTHDQSSAMHRANEIPKRFDTCFMLVSGIIGVEPKEVFFKNGNYLHMFPIAVVGHFAPAHHGERFKPTETMWLPSEMWNNVARSYNKVIKKGYPIRAVGHLISSKWTDKTSGEERKQFRFRITKLLKDEEFQAIATSTEEAVDAIVCTTEELGYDQTFQMDQFADISQIVSEKGSITASNG